MSGINRFGNSSQTNNSGGSSTISSTSINLSNIAASSRLGISATGKLFVNPDDSMIVDTSGVGVKFDPLSSGLRKDLHGLSIVKPLSTSMVSYTDIDGLDVKFGTLSSVENGLCRFPTGLGVMLNKYGGLEMDASALMQIKLENKPTNALSLTSTGLFCY